MSLIILNVDEVRRTLSVSDASAFVVNDKNVDIVRFALMTGFADIALDEHSALRVMYQRPGETEVRAKTLTYYDTDGLRNYYDWQLLSADLTEKGTLTVALCILRVDSEVEEWHTTPYQVRVLDTIHTDDSDEGDETITPTVAERVAVLESMIQRVASGAPIVVASTSAMTDTDQIYVLSTDGNWYYYDGTAWTAGGEYGAVATDTTLTQAGIPADAQAVGDEITTIKSQLSHIDGLSEDVKQAILQIAQNIPYLNDNGQDYYDNLYNAFYPSASLASITAVYNQSSTVYVDTPLNNLKPDIVVTAHYTDSTSAVVTGYALSGTLVVGTSTVTITYGGKSTTISVTVSASRTLSGISAIYDNTQIVYNTDNLDYLKSALTVKALYSDSTEETVTDYALSGNLSGGSQTITATYQGKTTTFVVTVYEFKFVKGLLSGQANNKACIKSNTARVLACSDVGNVPMNDESGVVSTVFAIPIRSGVSFAYVGSALGESSGYRKAFITLRFDTSINDFVQAYSTGWQTNERAFIETQYRTGEYLMLINISGATGSEDMSNIDTSRWSAYFTNA